MKNKHFYKALIHERRHELNHSCSVCFSVCIALICLATLSVASSLALKQTASRLKETGGGGGIQSSHCGGRERGGTQHGPPAVCQAWSKPPDWGDYWAVVIKSVWCPFLLELQRANIFLLWISTSVIFKWVMCVINDNYYSFWTCQLADHTLTRLSHWNKLWLTGKYVKKGIISNHIFRHSC